MKSIVRISIKVLTNEISLEEFEEEIYSDFYIDRINQDEIIYDVVTVDYKNDYWKKRLNNVIENYLTGEQSLLLRVYFLILQITQLSFKEKEAIFRVVEELSKLCLETNYEYDLLYYFYELSDEINLIEFGYSRDSNFIIIEVKNLTRDFLNKYDQGLSFDEIMTTDNDIVSSYESSKAIEDSIESPLDLESERSFIIEFVKQRILNLESKKRTFKKLKNLGYSEKLINESYDLTIANTIPSLKNRILIYSVIGIPIFYVGIMSVLKKDTVFFLIGFLFVGFGLLFTALLYLVKLIFYYSKKNNT